MYDLIIIGGGPAGAAAAVYAGRKRLKTAVITFDFNGQSVVSDNIQNWIGTISISGPALAKSLHDHVMAYAGEHLQIFEGEKVSAVQKIDGGFSVTTESEKKYEAKTILVATGSARRKLTIPGADIFEHKGVTYCASCDGPMFEGQDVVVIGGGNAGFETAAQLLAYTKSVTIVDAAKSWRADAITVEKVLKNPKAKGMPNMTPMEVKGEKFANALVVKNNETGELVNIPTGGIFVEIGQSPVTGFVKDLVKLNQRGAIEINPRNQETSLKGIWAAGDCTDVLYQQNNIAVGDALRALEDIYVYLKTK